MEIVTWLIVGLVVGGAIGALATWYISRARGGAVSVMQLKKENEQFRNEVTEHFVETGRLINQMTDSYKQVFDHLSSGAEKLVDNKRLAERLPPTSGQEVKLSQFGASVAAGANKTGSNQQSGFGDSTRASGADATKVPDRKNSKSSASADPLKSKPSQTGGATGQQSSTGSSGGSARTSNEERIDQPGDVSRDAQRRRPDGGSADKSAGVAEKAGSASNHGAEKSRSRD